MCWLIAWLIQHSLKRTLGVSLKIGKLGVLGFSKLQLAIRSGLTIEIDRVWLSSSLFNPDVRKPLVLCVHDMRIQANVGHEGEHRARDATPPGPHSVREGEAIQPRRDHHSRLENVLAKVLFFGQFCGLRVQNLTVMLLKTMIPDSLVHMTVGEIALDITIVSESYLIKSCVSNLVCKALKSGPGDADDQNCLAELSISINVEAKSDTTQPLQFKTIFGQVTKPQMMLTEGFLQNLPKRRNSATLPKPNYRELLEPEDEELYESEGEQSFLSNLRALRQLRALSFDISELDVKIVRQMKQRCLSVSLKHFLTCLNTTLTDRRTLNFNFSLSLEEFLTKSPQAQFAEMSKVSIKTESIRDHVEVGVKVYNGFFHYHHEEIQYWSTVFVRMSQGEATSPVHRSPRRRTATRSLLVSWLRARRTNINIDLAQLSTSVSSAACAGLHLQVSQTRICANVKAAVGAEDLSTWLSALDVGLEMEVQGICCCHLDARVSEGLTTGHVHYWDHVLYLALLIIKVQKLGKEVRVEAMQDSLHLEWSTKTFDILSNLTSTISRPRATTNQSVPKPFNISADHNRSPSVTASQSQQATVAERTKKNRFMDDDDDDSTKLKKLAKGPADGGSGRPLSVNMKLDVSNFSVFVCDSAGVCVMLHVNSVNATHSLSQSTVAVDVLKVLYLRYADNCIMLKRMSEVSSSVLLIREVKANYSEGNKELRVHILRELNVHWTTSAHMCVLQGVQNMATLRDKMKANRDVLTSDDKSEGVTCAKLGPNPSEHRSRLVVNILVHADIHLSASLSRSHRLSLHTHSLLITATLPSFVMEVRNFTVRCDSQDILSVTGFQLESLPASNLQLEREAFKDLNLPFNSGWAVSSESFDIIFPYKYCFADCYEEVLNTVKWLKLVHRIKKKPFTTDSPLPPDIKIKTKMLSIEVCDDPFEVKIGMNYELLKDEVLESKKRREVMDSKLEQLNKTKLIPVSKREELYASLYKKSSEVYIQRSKQMYNRDSGAIRTQLLTWLMEDLQIVALADLSYHGRQNVLKVMKELDKDSPAPTDDMEFVTLWCRSVNFSVKHWSVSLRDFPQPMIDITSMHVWGKLIGAEREGTKRAKRECLVEVDKPWGNMEVQRNLPALKFFHDFSSEITSIILAYGVCWEPAVALFNLAADLINKPSIDPSQPLPFWDKMRLLLHGRLTMAMSRMSWLYHASLDPYNNTELMDWTWSNLVLDWTNGQFVLKGDLDISLRTASKYNESKLLHLPNLKYCVGLQWICLGDANDHHSVMPCAPDKVPDFSHEEHDSFRAFRSQNLNLDLSLKTRPVPSNPPDVPSSPEFYASSLRFLEKIKQCMFSVTRPVRRGRLFGVTTLRKPQLTRHYRKFRLSVDFHRFVICHWMSNAKQHGAELLADSFTLKMCNRLTLVPTEDGLLHRPSADWSIKYLTNLLGPTQIYLCQEARLNESASSGGHHVEKSFFLSVSKINYDRAENRKLKPGEEVDPELLHKTPTHKISIHEMRGAWNERNRAVLLGLYDSYMKAQALRRNLSSEALKGFRVDNSQNSGMRSRSFSLNSPPANGAVPTADPMSPSPLSKLQMGHAHNMLLKLVSESDSKSVAFTEEPSNCNIIEMLHGVKACQPTSILSTKWLIELHNSQVVMKGWETPGFIIISAARARINSYNHMPIWRASQLRSKSTWTAQVDCMQYYATVDPDYVFSDDNIPWLSRENVEDRSGTGLTGLPEMVSSGQSVGSVVSSTISASSDQKSAGGGEQTVQLQRIIHRCSCKFYYANYGDVDPNSLPEVPLPPAEDCDVMTQEEGVDTFTMLHESLQAYSNSSQYAVIMDIVNNLLLYVEPKKKEASERLQDMRFKLQLSRDEDHKTPILQLQEVVRERVQDLRKLERDFYQAKMNDDEDQMQRLEVEMEDVKNWINTKNEELSMRISCYNESQLQMKAQLKIEKAQQAHVVRRNEVCFRYAKWRLTERDGHCGIAEVELRNFVYTKVNRDDNTWTHQLELGWVKMENLLSDNFYQKVLTPRDPLTRDGEENKNLLLRIFCSEHPPVGGIPVKEHFEVNVAPIQIQMTYQLYKAVMQFFFPDKNIEIDDSKSCQKKQWIGLCVLMCFSGS